jgi:type III secretion protein T
VLYVIDASMGFLNRFAQQFNVFSLALPIKSVAAALILILCLPLLANAITGDLTSREGIASGILDRIGTVGQ